MGIHITVFNSYRLRYTYFVICMEPDSSKTKPPFYARAWWRLPIDIGVAVLAVYFIVQFALLLLAPFDFYETLPDNVRVIDEEVTTYLETAPEVSWEAPATLPYELVFDTDASPQTAVDVYQAVLPSVVYLNVDDGFGYSAGSGVLLTADGLIATNYHVIEGAEKIGVTFSDAHTTHAVAVIAYDEIKDTALLKIAELGDTIATPVRVRPRTESLQVGDITYNVGHPENFLYTLGTGHVTSLRTYNDVGLGEQIQVSNPISQGSSGGPLFDEAGRLIGLTTWSVEYDANSVQVQSINFALPVSAILELLEF